MTIEIEEQTFEMENITQLYPAAMIPTGESNELTQISLEWYDTQKKSDIVAEKFGIFIHLKDKSVHPFYYENRQKLENAIEKLSKTLNN